MRRFLIFAVQKLVLIQAKVAHLVEHDLAKVGVASSSLVFRSNRLIGMYPLTVERADTSRLEMPIVKVDVHAPIFYFPKNIKRVGEHAKLIT